MNLTAIVRAKSQRAKFSSPLSLYRLPPEAVPGSDLVWVFPPQQIWGESSQLKRFRMGIPTSKKFNQEKFFTGVLSCLGFS